MVRILCISILCFSSWPVLAQGFEYRNVQKLPGVVNSSAEEVMPLLSTDGNTLYFSRAMSAENEGGIFAGQDIWTSVRTNGAWAKPSNSILYNNKNNNVVVGLSQNGKQLFLMDASRYHPTNGIFKGEVAASRSRRPVLMNIPGIQNVDFLGFYISPDEEVIFLSFKSPAGKGAEDLYYCVKDGAGAWSLPRSLGATINTQGFEISPFLSADKKRLYFASNGHGGEGDADIFYSERLYDSWETWSVPVNLGPSINSKKFDAYFSIYGDSICFFSSNREGKHADLYQAKVIQQKTILAKDQHYLTANEWDQIVGRNVNRELAFPHLSSTLSPAQKELVFYIVNKLMLDRGIQFHLVVKEEEDSVATSQRLSAITAHMKSLGIDQSRIHVDQLFTKDRTERGVIEIKLYQ